MSNERIFDLVGANEALTWLKQELARLQDLGTKGREAMEELDLDYADELTKKIEGILHDIEERGIVLRDTSSILVDFPAVINNMPAYFCWKPDEREIEYWHYLDEGFAGRKRIDGNESVLSPL